MSRALPRLTKAEIERLALLAEELGEALQAIGKVLRHGYQSHNPQRPIDGTNRGMLERELGDVRCAVALLTDAGDLSETRIADRADFKATAVPRYLHHQGAQP